MPGNGWTNTERTRLRELRPHMAIRDIAIELGKPFGSVAHESARLKLFRPGGTKWTQEEMQKIAGWWPDYSASQIGEKLNRSRNSVIGVIHREREKMNLKNKTTARPPRIAMANQPRITPPKPQPPPRPRAMLPMQCPCQLVELDAVNCKWPIGDPHQAGFYFCGGLITTERRPYCDGHLRIAHYPRPEPRRSLPS